MPIGRAGFLLVSLVLLGAWGCSGAPKGKQLVLEDGRTFPILGVVRRAFADGTPPALQLSYVTRTSLSDTVALLAEAKAIWTQFGREVERRSLSSAILTANAPPRGGRGPIWATRVQSYGFILDKGPDGLWRFESDPRPLAPVTSGSMATTRRAD